MYRSFDIFHGTWIDATQHNFEFVARMITKSKLIIDVFVVADFATIKYEFCQSFGPNSVNSDVLAGDSSLVLCSGDTQRVEMDFQSARYDIQHFV